MEFTAPQILIVQKMVDVQMKEARILRRLEFRIRLTCDNYNTFFQDISTDLFTQLINTMYNMKLKKFLITDNKLYDFTFRRNWF